MASGFDPDRCLSSLPRALVAGGNGACHAECSSREEMAAAYAVKSSRDEKINPLADDVVELSSRADALQAFMHLRNEVL